MNRKALVLALLGLSVLASCGAQTSTAANNNNYNNNNNNNGGNHTPVSDNGKAAAIAYAKKNGTLSDGTYIVGASKTSTSGSYTFKQIAGFFYKPSSDLFGVSGICDGTKSDSSTTIEWSLTSAFSWGDLKGGAYVGSAGSGSYTCDFTLDVSQTSSGQISQSTYTVKSNTLGLESDDIKSSVKLCIGYYNDAMAWINGKLGDTIQ